MCVGGCGKVKTGRANIVFAPKRQSLPQQINHVGSMQSDPNFKRAFGDAPMIASSENQQCRYVALLNELIVYMNKIKSVLFRHQIYQKT